jgi:predicted acyltransferase
MLVRRRKRSDRGGTVDLQTTARAAVNEARPPRLGALDLLRGFTVAAMIVVNNPGNWDSVFPQLTHAAWNGVTFADLIFPAFIFIMGVAMALALPPHRSSGTVRPAAYRRIGSRALLLVLMGLALNAATAWPAVSSARIPGVLQRIGVTYLAAALIVSHADRRRQWQVAVGLLVVHWVALALPFAGAGDGRWLEPGRNVAAVIDRAIFGTHTLSPMGDPEGALGLLTSVATALFGALVGDRVRRDTEVRYAAGADAPPSLVLVRLAVAGSSAVALGYAWSFVLPLNKALWTASFAMLASGVATLGLVACVMVDRPGIRRLTTPLLWLGTNPLAVYFLSELLAQILQRPWLVEHGHAVAPKDLAYWSGIVPVLHDNGGPWSSLVYAVAYTLLWTAVAGVMRWRGVRLRV